jgi:hypothetical protein
VRKNVYDRVDRLGYTDLKQFHSRNLAGKPYTYCIVASDKKISEDDMKKIGAVKKLSLEEIFGY